MTPSRLLVLSVAVVACLVGPARQAEAAPIDFTGHTVQYTWFYPDTGTILEGPFSAVVGAGPEFLAFGQPHVPIDISASNITITWDLTFSPAFSAGTFNGPQFLDLLGTIAPITGVSINSSSTLAGFTSSRIFFDANTIRLNFESLQLQAGHTVLSLDINPEVTEDPAAVPEPTTLVLFGSGLLGIVVTARARRKRGL